MKKILNIISDTNIGGAGRVILNYLHFADRTNYDTWVAVPRGSLLRPPLEEAGAHVLEVDGIADRSYAKEDVALLRRVIAQTAPHLVHTHGCFSGRVAARREHVPVVYSRHSAFPVPPKLKYPPGRWVNKLVNEHYADRIIAVSPATRDNLTEAGISPKKITVVMNGVSPVTPLPPPEREALRLSLDLPAEGTTFGILARIEDYKGHLYIAQAARLLRDRGRSDFRVLVAGTGGFEADLRRAVRDLGVEDAVRLLGFRSDADKLLSLLDVQLNASYGTEATSMALLEGMSLGLPTIASDYGGNPYVIRDGETGLLFPSRDPRALADAMLRLMDHPQEREALGQRAREDFLRRFTGDVFARETEKVYESILQRGK